MHTQARWEPDGWPNRAGLTVPSICKSSKNILILFPNQMVRCLSIHYENIYRYTMPLKRLECQVPEGFNSDTRPRPTTGDAAAVRLRRADRVLRYNKHILTSISLHFTRITLQAYLYTHIFTHISLHAYILQASAALPRCTPAHPLVCHIH